jgi:hypothetical protein
MQGHARINNAAAFARARAVIAIVRQLDEPNQGKPLWQEAIQMPYGFEPRRQESERRPPHAKEAAINQRHESH